MTRHAYRGTDGRRCLGITPDATAEAKRELVAYQLGDVDCIECLTRMIEHHVSMADALRDQRVLAFSHVECEICGRLGDHSHCAKGVP